LQLTPSIFSLTQKFSVKTATEDTIFIISKIDPQRFHGDESIVFSNIETKLLNNKALINTLIFLKLAL